MAATTKSTTSPKSEDPFRAYYRATYGDDDTVATLARARHAAARRLAVAILADDPADLELLAVNGHPADVRGAAAEALHRIERRNGTGPRCLVCGSPSDDDVCDICARVADDETRRDPLAAEIRALAHHDAEELEWMATCDEYSPRERDVALAALAARRWTCVDCHKVDYDEPRDDDGDLLCDRCYHIRAAAWYGLSGQDQAAYDAWVTSRGVA